MAVADLGDGVSGSDSGSDSDDEAPRAHAAPCADAGGVEARAPRAQREARRRESRALPRPKGTRGGAHASRAAWSPEETEALLRLRPTHAETLPSWALLTRELAQHSGRPLRSPTSVRMHWLRLRHGRARAQLPRGDAARAKNFCRRCGLIKLGHVCTAPVEADGEARGVDAMTAQARRAIEEGALESEGEGEDAWW